MPKLREFVIRQIMDELFHSGFDMEKFDISFPEDLDSDKLACIFFKSYPEYSFNIEEYNLSDQKLSERERGILKTDEKPGDYKMHEIKLHSNIDDCISRVYY